MAKRMPKKDRWMNDGDDAHFSDNPAVGKRSERKRESKHHSKTTVIKENDHETMKAPVAKKHYTSMPSVKAERKYKALAGKKRFGKKVATAK